MPFAGQRYLPGMRDEASANPPSVMAIPLRDAMAAIPRRSCPAAKPLFPAPPPGAGLATSKLPFEFAALADPGWRVRAHQRR